MTYVMSLLLNRNFLTYSIHTLFSAKKLQGNKKDQTYLTCVLSLIPNNVTCIFPAIFVPHFRMNIWVCWNPQVLAWCTLW